MIAITINGERREVDVPPDMPLLWVLRDVLGMTGTKFGCGMALCGACTVHLDGHAIRSCVAGQRDRPEQDHDDRGCRRDAQRRESAAGVAGPGSHSVRLLPVGSDHVGDGAARLHSAPDDADIDAAMAGNICRCGTYGRIREAIKRAAAEG